MGEDRKGKDLHLTTIGGHNFVNGNEVKPPVEEARKAQNDFGGGPNVEIPFLSRSDNMWQRRNELRIQKDKEEDKGSGGPTF